MRMRVNVCPWDILRLFGFTKDLWRHWHQTSQRSAKQEAMAFVIDCRLFFSQCILDPVFSVKMGNLYIVFFSFPKSGHLIFSPNSVSIPVTFLLVKERFLHESRASNKETGELFHVYRFLTFILCNGDVIDGWWMEREKRENGREKY